jgi:hypothetical protein
MTGKRGPTRAKLLEQIEEHDAVLAEKEEELTGARQQVQMLAQVPPLLFMISVNRVTGNITSVPQVGPESSVEDLRLLLKALNIYSNNVVDAIADKATPPVEEGEIPGDEETSDDNEEVVNEEEVDNEEVVSEEPSEE